MGFFLGVFLVFGFAFLKLFNIQSLRWILPGAIGATVLFGLAFMKQESFNLRRITRVFGSFFFVVIFSIAVSGVFFDDSFDGRWYHQEGILRLSNGFDPQDEIMPIDSIPGGVWSLRETHDTTQSAMFWLNHYPLGSEILASTIVALTSNVESGMAFNFIFLISAWALAFGALGRAYPDWSAWSRGFLCLCAVACPVSVNQAWTYMVDGQMFLILFGLGVFLVLGIGEGRLIWWLGACGCFVLLSNLKFTGFVNGTFFLGIAFLYVLVKQNWKALRSLVFFGVLGVAFATCVVGYHPYVKNVLNDGHPFSPLMGPKAMDIMTDVSSRNFIQKNRFHKFFISAFTQTSHLLPSDGTIPQVKIPLTVSKQELRDFSRPDARLSGFGPFFGTAFLLGSILYISSFWARRRDEQSGAFVTGSNFVTWLDWAILAILGAVVLNPEFWWARYVPQLWIVPILFGAAFAFHWGKSIPSWFPWVCLAFYASPVAAMTPYMIGLNLRTSLQIEKEMVILSESLPLRSSEMGIHHGQLVGDRATFLKRGLSIQPVAFSFQLKGVYRDTLLRGGVIAHSDVTLNRKLNDLESQDSRTNLLRLLSRRIFWWIPRFYRGSIG